MKRIAGGVLIFLAFVFSGHTLFETTLHEQGCYYEGISVIPSGNGGWLVSGAYNCDGIPAAWKSCLVGIDAAGDTLAVSRDNPYNGIMRRTSDGNLIFAGGNHAGFVYDTAKIFKVDSAGNILWEKSVFAGYCHHLLTDILPLENGFLVLGNYAQGSCNSPVYDSYVARFDDSGNLSWRYDVGGAGNDQLHVVKLTNDRNIAAFGWTENKSSVDDADYFLIKLDTNGNKIWSQTFGDAQDNYGYGMDVTQDNGFILNGHSSTMDVMRIDANGNLMWSKLLTETCGGRYFKAYASQDGGYVFLGMEKTASQSCRSTLIKTNSNGEIFWKKNFAGTLRECAEGTQGELSLTGYKSYLPQLYIVGFDSIALPKEIHAVQMEFFQPEVYPLLFSHDTILGLATGNALETREQDKRLVVYPNPSSGTVHLAFENTEKEAYALEMFNGSGKRVMNILSADERISVDCSMLPKGMYSYRLSGSGKNYYGKILMQ